VGVTAKWLVTEEEKAKYIAALTNELPPLRAKVGISQGELAYLIGVSRQTYSAIEGGKREMSWSTYLALIFFFDSNQGTRQMIRNVSAYPEDMVLRFNNGSEVSSAAMEELFGLKSAEIERMARSMDESSLHMIKTLLLAEYGRCTKMSAEEVLRMFSEK
jgi:DNA-binding XRE family transcriptional regulator